MHAPKLAMVFPVRFAHAQRVEQTTAHEVSVEGIFVRCQEPPRAGIQVSLKLYLPDKPQTVDLVGLVRGPEMRGEADGNLLQGLRDLAFRITRRVQQELPRVYDLADHETPGQ